MDRRYHPMRRGFDEFVGFRGGWQDYYDWNLDVGYTRKACDGRYLTDVLAEEAVQFLRRHRRVPFLLYVPFNAPHFPFQVPQPALDSYRGQSNLTSAVATIYAMVTQLDAAIGSILSELESLGLANRTLVMFTSDNGPQFSGEGDESTYRSNCGMNGAKTSVLEGGIRLPMIMRWPERLGKAQECRQATHLTDWLPTLARWCGWEKAWDRPLDGHDIRDVLIDGVSREAPDRFWQWNRYTPVGTSNAAVRDGDWKLVRPAIREAMRVAPADGEMDRRLKYEPEAFADISRSPEPERQIPPPPPALLYNIGRDPYERVDLAHDEPERAALLLRMLETWFEAVEAERLGIRD
jgi:arylsulfatase A